MPRIFHVTLTKECDVTIVGDSLQEVQSAVTSDKSLLDQLDNEVKWEVSVRDPLKSLNSKQVPREFSPPEMGVLEGVTVDILDYKEAHPRYLDELETDAAELRYQKGVEEENLKLPGV